MKTLMKLVSAGSAALVAGAGLAVLAPASSAEPVARKTTYSGSMTIKLDSSLKAIANRVEVTPPAKKKGFNLTFPVIGVEGNGILLAGGTRAGTDPVITTNDNGTGAVSITVGRASIEVFRIKNWALHHTSKKGEVTTQIWHGDLYLTSKRSVVDALNAGVDRPLFKAGQAMGTIHTTVQVTKS